MCHYFSNQLLKDHHIVLLNPGEYTICDSWNTYHVIKTAEVDPFVPISILGYLTVTTVYSLYRERGKRRERGKGGRWLGFVIETPAFIAGGCILHGSGWPVRLISQWMG